MSYNQIFNFHVYLYNSDGSEIPGNDTLLSSMIFYMRELVSDANPQIIDRMKNYYDIVKLLIEYDIDLNLQRKYI